MSEELHREITIAWTMNPQPAAEVKARIAAIARQFRIAVGAVIPQGNPADGIILVMLPAPGVDAATAARLRDAIELAFTARGSPSSP